MILKKKKKNKNFHFTFLIFAISISNILYIYSTSITSHFQPHFLIMSDSLTYFQYALQNFQRCKKKKKKKSNLLHKTQSIRSTYFLVHLLNGHDGSAFVITTNKMFNQYAFFHCECTWNVCVNFLHFSPRHENVRLEKKKEKKNGKITRRYSC